MPGAAAAAVAVAVAELTTSASKKSIRRLVITEKAPTRAFSWLKAATTALNVKLGPRRNYHNGRAAIRHYANPSFMTFALALFVIVQLHRLIVIQH